jgi:hypothetical protein
VDGAARGGSVIVLADSDRAGHPFRWKAAQVKFLRGETLAGRNLGKLGEATLDGWASDRGTIGQQA